MATLADIRKASETDVHACVDDDTPGGHFLATARILAITTTYLCAGAQSDLDAPIVGRIEWPLIDSGRAPVAVRGSGIKGGQALLGAWADSAAAFKAMVAQ
ncbi:hypothetical protein ABT369_39415 [Dactylosporangium sp. NPDC000244]|uniref:hypothetical protein n=1 Tax=Dactylosporangium sp. NPDC000244 TaxID=3154365 RepID=UPI003316B481